MTTIFGYGVGNFGFSLLGLVVSVNLQFFYTDYVGLSAGLVSWSLLFARMSDAVTDPVMGWLSDHTNTRIGRRRPWILGAAIPLGFLFYCLFSPPVIDNPSAQQGFLLLYMLSFYVLTYFIWTLGGVPYYSLGAELTDDYHERVKVIAVREAFALSGLLIATVLPAFLIYVYGGRKGYAFMGGILGTTAAMSLLFSGMVTRERVEFRGRESINPYAGWIATFANPHFRKLLVAFFFSSVAASVPSVLIIYISVYVIGTPQWWAEAIPGWMPTWSFYLLLYFGCGVLSLPLWNRIAKRLGKRDTWAIAIFLITLLHIGCYWLDKGTIVYFSFLMAFAGMSYGNYLALPPSIVADIIDYDEVRTGRRREGSYFAIWAFVTKLGAAVAGFASLQILEHVGYIPGVEQTSTVIKWMVWMYSIFPATLYLLSGITLFRFNFSRNDLEETQRQLGRA